MANMKYFDGRRVIEIEVNKQTQQSYKEALREEWRTNKRAERHQTAISLSQMEDESRHYFEDYSILNPIEYAIVQEEREERISDIKAMFASLTQKQLSILIMLYEDISVTEIAKRLGIGKTAVSNMRIRIQKKFEKI